MFFLKAEVAVLNKVGGSLFPASDNSLVPPVQLGTKLCAAMLLIWECKLFISPGPGRPVGPGLSFRHPGHVWRRTLYAGGARNPASGDCQYLQLPILSPLKT